MIEPYQAVGLIQTMRGIRRREEISWNLEHISHMVKAASWLSSMDLPVRLICIPEGGLQGFTDEVLDLDHETYARECAIDIPGPETDQLGRLARQWNAHVIAQAKARHPEFPGRFFNVGFVIEPEDGTVVLKHHKLVPLLPVEHSVTPHNVWDRWIELYGRELSAFYPVADTAIGRIGIMMANEASYPENARGLAMNGCEIAYRGPYPAPGVMSGMFSVQTRARALDNNMYVIAMNLGTYYLDKDTTIPIDTFSGGSQIVDYRGHVVTEVPYGAGSTWIGGTVDIEALRHFRQTAQWDNWMKDLTTEQYQLDLRAAGLPQEPVPGARAVHPRRVPRGGDAPAGGAATGTGGLGATDSLGRTRRGARLSLWPAGRTSGGSRSPCPKRAKGPRGATRRGGCATNSSCGSVRCGRPIYAPSATPRRPGRSSALASNTPGPRRRCSPTIRRSTSRRRTSTGTRRSWCASIRSTSMSCRR